MLDAVLDFVAESPIEGFRRERPGELRHSTLDTARLQAQGWAPRFSLEEGLRETYRHIEAQGREAAE